MPELPADLAAALPAVALTNGTLFSRRLLDRVSRLAGVAVALQISLDRPDPDTNDAMRAPENLLITRPPGRCRCRPGRCSAWWRAGRPGDDSTLSIR
jgi:hypothetical protein